MGMRSLIAAGLKSTVGHLLAFVSRKPYWAMHPDVDLEAMADNLHALAARVHELEEGR